MAGGGRVRGVLRTFVALCCKSFEQNVVLCCRIRFAGFEPRHALPPPPPPPSKKSPTGFGALGFVGFRVEG